MPRDIQYYKKALELMSNAYWQTNDPLVKENISKDMTYAARKIQELRLLQIIRALN